MSSCSISFTKDKNILNNVKKKQDFILGFTLMLNSIFTTIILTGMNVLADVDGHSLSDIVDTEAFQGSWRWADKFNWIGAILNFLITALCFIGIVCICLQFLLTLTYFSNRSFWDNVHEIKTSNAGSSIFGKTTPFGLGGYLKEFAMPTKTSGLDTIFNLLYIFIPDIKEYSEMGELNGDRNLTDDDTLTTWILKTSGRKIFVLLLFSMGFNGTLMKCYMMIVDGLGVATNRIATYNSEAFVNNWLNSGDNFDFTLGASGKGCDVVQGTVAQKMYKSVLAEIGAENQSRDIKQTIGKNIESTVASQMNQQTIKNSLVDGGYIEESYEMTDSDWALVKCNISTSSSSNSEMGRISVDMDSIVGSYKGATLNKSMYMNIQFSMTKKAASHNYLELN